MGHGCVETQGFVPAARAGVHGSDFGGEVSHTLSMDTWAPELGVAGAPLLPRLRLGLGLLVGLAAWLPVGGDLSQGKHQVSTQ